MMKIILITLCVVGQIWAIGSRKKIDAEEKVAMKTPGTASRLRERYGELVNLLTNNPKHMILFERKYDESIRFGNTKGQELFLSYSGLGQELHVACIQDSMVIMERTYNNQTSIAVVYNEICDYFD